MPYINPNPGFSPLRHSGIIAAAQTAYEQMLSVIANNLSNSDTVGYKAGKARFKEILHQSADGQRISYVKVDDVVYNQDQGGFKQTNIKTHFALNGRGYFKVRTSKGDYYTRNGEFLWSENGQLITHTGDPVLSQEGEVITRPAAARRFDANSAGQLFADGALFATLGTHAFESEKHLKREGNSLFSTTKDPIAFSGTILQGHLEQSNTVPMQEIVNLTFTHRHFEAAQKMLDEYDRTMRRTIGTSPRNV